MEHLRKDGFIDSLGKLGTLCNMFLEVCKLESRLLAAVEASERHDPEESAEEGDSGRASEEDGKAWFRK